MQRSVVIASVLPAVLAACGGRNSCSDWDPGPDRYTNEFTMVEAEDSGARTDGECERLCVDHAEGYGFYDVRVVECALTDGDTGIASTVECTYSALAVCKGRLHATVVSRARRSRGVGAWFAAATHDEAAAVEAFRALARELADHRAPPDLVLRAQAAAADEVRHARAMAALAREHGVEPQRAQVRDVAGRDLLAIALENAAEGCARETFAALVAHWQARHADRRYRDLFARLAEDETRHAQWSWDLDAWLGGVLSGGDRERVAQVRSAAIAALGGSGGPRLLGVPTRTAARALATRLRSALPSA